MPIINEFKMRALSSIIGFDTRLIKDEGKRPMDNKRFIVLEITYNGTHLYHRFDLSESLNSVEDLILTQARFIISKFELLCQTEWKAIHFNFVKDCLRLKEGDIMFELEEELGDTTTDTELRTYIFNILRSQESGICHKSVYNECIEGFVNFALDNNKWMDLYELNKYDRLSLNSDTY